ncbi:hemagglutinin repeat-containing protein [Iodobacter fluviatilis]|uniref:Filamentous hemagglutinin n=1 Tax=Iodobacter fluviatilis TaxID=537 RepID=A0A377Q968_9NEIS|nr:hemagglutinin repeat-containing protein [Iodobacter fluviatilis]TCU88819.1 filamentous hemagglutinin [Iodobacter fluviatilis]STQ91109.1 Filamentous hemagglutinin [Iodobacter fluviatilis]
MLTGFVLKAAIKFCRAIASDHDWAGGRTGYLDKQSTQQNISSISAGGTALVVAGDRLSLVGTNVHAGKDLTLQGASVQIEAVKERLAGDDQRAGNDKYDRHAFSKESLQGGSITAGQNLNIKAAGPDGNFTLKGADLLAEKGQLSLAAKKDIELASIDLTQTDTQETYRHSRGWFSSSTSTTYDFSRTTQAVGNSLSGNSINVQAGKDIKVNGSAIAATQDVQLLAGNDVKITAGTNSSKDIHDRKESKSGLFSGGGFGFTYGKQEQQTHTDADGSIQSQNRSLVGSEQGKLTIQAGNAVQVTGSDLSALAGDIALKGKQVTVDPGQDRHQSTETQTFKQSGITVAVSAPALTMLQAAQTVAESAKTAGESKDSRVKALSVGTAALAAKNGIDAAKAAAADPKSVSVSITYGESKSESTTKTSSISHSGSTLNAGGDIQISAVGDKASQLNVLGSEINAKGNIKLKSDGDINLQSALDESEQHSKNSSSSWGAGVAITFGQGGASYGVTANGSLSRGHADGKDTAQQNSHINAGKTLALESGNDTRIEGAVVSGNKIVADIGGDLKLASRQDTSQFDSKQSSVSASVTVGVGVSGSASISQDKMKSDYAAVTEQSGLFAGKDGFEIKVKNNTDLNGAVIASKSDDNTLSTGTLTQKDINNHAEYSASSIGIGGGFSLGGTEKKPEDGKAPSTDQAAAPAGNKLYDAGPSGVTPTAPVALSAGDNGTSTTKSAIATAKITITDEAKQKELTGKTAAETIASLSRDTDGAQQQLTNDFKPEKINELFSATKTFLQEGNTFMANRTAEADAAKKALAENTDPNAEKALKDNLTEANRWTPGGDYGRAMTALQVAVGGNVSGGATGLLQNASVAYLQSLGAEKIKEIANSFQTVKGEENQTSQNVRAALHAIASCAGAAATSSNCSSAAVGAASSVVINNVLSEIENTNADKMTASEKEKRKNLVGSIITGIVAATDGNAAAANNAAQIEMQNNMLANARQIDRIKQLAKGDKNKEVRLLAAACAQLKCTAGLAKDDPNYSIYSALESLGKTDALKGERELLAKQTDPVQLVYLGGSAELPIFGQYSDPMAWQDAASRNQLGTRVMGSVQAVGGAAEIVGAVGLATTCGTVVGCVASSALATSGADNLHTGVKTAVDGKATNTVGAQIIQQVLGTNPETSELLYAAMQLGASPSAVSKLEKALDANLVGKAWESSKILNAGEVTASGKGFISTQQITTQGVPAALNQAELTQLSKLSRLDTGQAGALRETVADAYFSRNGFTALDGKCGSNCFDGVYFKGDQVIINEVKPLNANNSIKLTGPNPTTALPPQMSDQWIRSRANELSRSGDPAKATTGSAILKALDNGTLVKMVSGVDSVGMTMVKLK